MDQEPRQGRWITLTPGEHAIAIQALGFQAFLDTLTLSAGETRTFTPPLIPLPREFGGLSVFSMPAGTLYIDDVAIGELPVRDHEMAAGAHHIRIEAPGCIPYDTTITVQSDSTVNLGLITLTRRGS